MCGREKNIAYYHGNQLSFLLNEKHLDFFPLPVTKYETPPWTKSFSYGGCRFPICYFSTTTLNQRALWGSMITAKWSCDHGKVSTTKKKKQRWFKWSHLKSGDILSVDSECNKLTAYTARCFPETHQLESVVHISPSECRMCTARESKLFHYHIAHCVSRTCKVSWRRSVQYGPKRSCVCTLQSVHCLSVHFTPINVMHQLSPASDSIYTSEQNFFSSVWNSFYFFFPLKSHIHLLGEPHKKQHNVFLYSSIRTVLKPPPRMCCQKHCIYH